MKKLTEFQGQPLAWGKPALLRRDYELRAGGVLVGTLCFRGAFGTLAVAECAEAGWTIKRTGFWQTRVTVRATGAETDLAVFRNNTWKGGGKLEFPDGRKFRATNNTWQTRYEFRTEGDVLLLTFKPGGWTGQTADIEVTPAGWQAPELAMLVMVGWYLAIMTQADTAAASVVASSAT